MGAELSPNDYSNDTLTNCPNGAIYTPRDSIIVIITHRPQSSSLLGLPYRILNMNPKKEPLWGLWVRTEQPYKLPVWGFKDRTSQVVA